MDIGSPAPECARWNTVQVQDVPAIFVVGFSVGGIAMELAVAGDSSGGGSPACWMACRKSSLGYGNVNSVVSLLPPRRVAPVRGFCLCLASLPPLRRAFPNPRFDLMPQPADAVRSKPDPPGNKALFFPDATNEPLKRLSRDHVQVPS